MSSLLEDYADGSHRQGEHGSRRGQYHDRNDTHLGPEKMRRPSQDINSAFGRRASSDAGRVKASASAPVRGENHAAGDCAPPSNTQKGHVGNGSPHDTACLGGVQGTIPRDAAGIDHANSSAATQLRARLRGEATSRRETVRAYAFGFMNSTCDHCNAEYGVDCNTWSKYVWHR